MTIALVAGLVALAVLVAVPALAMAGMRLGSHIDFAQTWRPSDAGVQAESLELTTSDGVRLAAWHVRADVPRASIVIVSGIHQPSVTAYFPHARWLRERGYSSILVELRSHGASEGTGIHLGMREWRDVSAAARYAAADTPGVPIVAFGVSMGGAAAINAAGQDPRIDAVIACSAFSSWSDVVSDTMRRLGIPGVLVAIERPFVVALATIRWGRAEMRITPIGEIRKLGERPALLIHSRGDSQVPFASFERLVAAAPEVSTLVVEGDNHLILGRNLMNPGADPRYAQKVLDFLAQM